MLIDQKMSHIELQRDEPVNLAILDRICQVLGCDFDDIVEHLDDSETVDA